jgi:hypothetical protein
MTDSARLHARNFLERKSASVPHAQKNRATKRAVGSNKSSRFIKQPLTRLLGMASPVNC